jgi:RNA polymerase sigma-70 factor (ECF subfamily)
VDQAGRRRLQDDLARLGAGDRAAFHPVFAALLPLLRRFAGRGLPAADAEDAAQEALVKIFFRASEFDPTRDALSWALGVAAYEIKTTRRRRDRRREVDGEQVRLDGWHDPAPSPEGAAIAADLDAALDAALDALSPADADTLRAFARKEHPVGVAPATFRKRVERGLARLRDQWRSTHGRG